MEKRRLTSLRSVLLQYLVRTALACLLVAVGWLLVMMLWIQNGGAVSARQSGGTGLSESRTGRFTGHDRSHL